MMYLSTNRTDNNNVYDFVNYLGFGGKVRLMKPKMFFKAITKFRNILLLAIVIGIFFATLNNISNVLSF